MNKRARIERARKAGSVSTPRKAEAARKNGALGGKLGGRPRRYPLCPKYSTHRFSKGKDRCPCGYVRG